MSRSVLAERFAHFVGVPPMQYLAQWRMQLAATLLSGTRRPRRDRRTGRLRLGDGAQPRLQALGRRRPTAWREGVRRSAAFTPPATRQTTPHCEARWNAVRWID